MKSVTITDKGEINKILNKCDVCYVGMIDTNGFPYIIPMNFGYRNGEIFLHSSASGKKIDSLMNNKNVCVSFSTDHMLRFQSEKVACSYSMKYRSVLASGEVEFIEDFDDKIDALNCIMQNYTDKEFKYSDPAVKDVCVFKVKITNLEGRVYGY